MDRLHFATEDVRDSGTRYCVKIFDYAGGIGLIALGRRATKRTCPHLQQLQLSSKRVAMMQFLKTIINGPCPQRTVCPQKA